jgi:hypothetical protein
MSCPQCVSRAKKLKPAIHLNEPFVPYYPVSWRKLTQKGQKCALDQENTPDKGKENRGIPVKICLLSARSMRVNTRYTKINPTD